MYRAPQCKDRGYKRGSVVQNAGFRVRVSLERCNQCPVPRFPHAVSGGGKAGEGGGRSGRLSLFVFLYGIYAYIYLVCACSCVRLKSRTRAYARAERERKHGFSTALVGAHTCSGHSSRQAKALCKQASRHTRLQPRHNRIPLAGTLDYRRQAL